MIEYKYISRILYMYILLVVMAGIYVIIIFFVNWHHKIDHLPFFYVNHKTLIKRMPIRSANLIYYRDSRYYNECRLLYPSKTNECDMNPLLYYFSKYDYIEKTNDYIIDDNTNQYLKPLSYSEENFRHASYPILWLDVFGDVHWNEPAERQMYEFLIDKQFPKSPNIYDDKYKIEDYINDCESRHLILLEQWTSGGFFSRVNCFIEQFGQTLYSPFMAILLPRKFNMGSAGKEDFLNEGILGYYAPMSLCSTYMSFERMKNISENVRISTENHENFVKIETFEQLRKINSSQKYLWLEDQWKFGYEHIPHRKWIFDRMSYKSKMFVYYNSSIDILMNHTFEHIYYDPNIKFDLKKWQPRNLPPGNSTIHLNYNYTITWKDKVFTSFLRYMFTLFFHQFAPRIEASKNLLTKYWSSYLADKKHQSYEYALSSMAVVYARRGDHALDDPFYRKFGKWRGISLFIKNIYNEEKNLNKTFSSIFFLSDDPNFVNSAIEFSSKYTLSLNERFARKYLFGRDVIYNIYAPDTCRKPLSRFDFDQYLVNVHLIIRHSTLIVTQILSNLGTYLEAFLYAEKQLLPNHQTNTRIKYVKDNF